MKMSTREYGTATVLALCGQLTINDETRPLWELVESVTAAPSGLIVLDLENISRLDCSGIGQLVGLHSALQESGAVLTLVNVAPRQKRMLELVGLLPVLKVCNDLEEALARQENGTTMLNSALSMPAVLSGYADPYVVNTAALMSRIE